VHRLSSQRRSRHADHTRCFIQVRKLSTDYDGEATGGSVILVTSAQIQGLGSVGGPFLVGKDSRIPHDLIAPHQHTYVIRYCVYLEQS
jgi:hypothetical protein